MTIASLEEKSSEDIAYKNFGKKLSEFLTSFLPRYGIDLPADTKFPIKLSKDGKVCFATQIHTIFNTQQLLDY